MEIACAARPLGRDAFVVGRTEGPLCSRARTRELLTLRNRPRCRGPRALRSRRSGPRMRSRPCAADGATVFSAKFECGLDALGTMMTPQREPVRICPIFHGFTWFVRPCGPDESYSDVTPILLPWEQ
jgi:hypothetical protein